jgi:hypothetical protein
MPILLAGTTEFVHIEQVSALFKFRLGQVLLYILGSKHNVKVMSPAPKHQTRKHMGGMWLNALSTPDLSCRRDELYIYNT